MVCVNSNGNSVWVSMRGVQVKCNIDRVRLATDSEWLGAELIKVLSADAKKHIERAGQRGYVDATSEDGPTEQDEEPDSAEHVTPDSVAPSTGPLDTIHEEGEPAASETSTRDPVPAGIGQTGPDSQSSTSSTSSSSESPAPKQRKRSEPQARTVRPRLETDPLSAAASASGASPSVSVDPRVDERSLADVASSAPSTPRQQPSTPGSASFTPHGGWRAAQDRAARPTPYSGIQQSHYFTALDVLPNTFSSYEQAIGAKTAAGSGTPSPVVKSVTADHCWIALDEGSNKLWVMLQGADASSVEYRHLKPSDRKVFDASRNKEIVNLLDLGAYRILSLEDSLKFRAMYPDCVLPSRWVDRWKAQDAGSAIAKSRIVILGFKDPQVLQLERSAPTPTHEAFMTVMQIMASTQRAAWSSDIRNAFAQSRKTTRQQPIAASLPQGMIEAGFDLDPRQLLLCETEVYGLISGPSWLRQSLVCDFESLGYQRMPYDKCIMTLAPAEGVLNDGIVLIEVDDIFEGGNKNHQDRMEKFYSKYKCGKRKKLIDLGSEGTLISGIRVLQHKDFSFSWNMNEYAAKMQPIQVPRGYMSQTTEITDEIMSQVMSCNGQIGWIGGNGRPDLAAGHSIIAGQYKDRKPQLVADCNQCVKQAKEHILTLRIWHIPVRDLRFVSFL